MAIEVKDITTNETKEVSSNTKANTALGFGILGTALGAFGLAGAGAAAYRGSNGNGSGNGNGGSVEQDSSVSIFRYFENREKDNNRMWELHSMVERELCGLRERIAVNETANRYQNQIIGNGFESVDERFATEQYINNLILQNALCDVVRGENVLPMSKLGLKVADELYGIDTHKMHWPHHYGPHGNYQFPQPVQQVAHQVPHAKQNKHSCALRNF